MGSVFNTNTKCSLPSIPAIGGFDFISDCTVPDAPPPIYECPDMEFDLPFAGPAGPPGVPGIPGPPGPPGAGGADGPCPEISVSATGDVKQNKTVNAPTMEVQAEIRNKNSHSSEPCAKELDLKINMSLPCPEVDFDGDVEVNKTILSPSLEVTQTEKYPETEQCGQLVDFKINLPCADLDFDGNIELKKSIVTPKLDITTADKYPSTDQCGQIVDFGVSLPCPEVEFAGHGKAKQARDISTPKLNITEAPKYPATDQCGENVSMGLSLPCPDFDFTGQLTTLAAGATPTLEVEQTNKYPATQQCGSIINFKFNIPKATAWCSGNGAPGSGVCDNGDYYLDLITNDVYIKIGGSWTGPVTNLKGRDGSNGSNGSDGRDGSDGKDGGPMACCPQTYYASIVTGVYCQGNQLIVQYQS